MVKRVLVLGIDEQWTMPDGSLCRSGNLARQTLDPSGYQYTLVLLQQDIENGLQIYYDKIRNELQSNTQYDAVSIGGNVQKNASYMENIHKIINEVKPGLPIALPQSPDGVVKAIKSAIGDP